MRTDLASTGEALQSLGVESPSVLLQELKRQLMIQFPGEIEQMLVFGSFARQEQHEESDIDVLIVSTSSDWRRHDAMHDACYEINQRLHFRLSIHVVPHSRLQTLQQHQLPFARSLAEDSVPL